MLFDSCDPLRAISDGLTYSRMVIMNYKYVKNMTIKQIPSIDCITRSCGKILIPNPKENVDGAFLKIRKIPFFTGRVVVVCCCFCIFFFFKYISVRDSRWRSIVQLL